MAPGLASLIHQSIGVDKGDKQVEGGQAIRMNKEAKQFKYALRMSLTSLFAMLVLSAYGSGVLASKGLSIPDGTLIEVKMIDGVNTGANKSGDLFEASLARDLNVGGRQIARKGSPARGSVVEVISSGRLKRPAFISLKLTELTLSDGRTVSIETSPYSIDGKSHALRNAGLIGGGAGAGAVLGGIAGGKTGALIGSAVGAGAGTTAAYLTGKEEIAIPPETNLRFTTGRDVSTTHPSSESQPDTRSNAVLPREEQSRPAALQIMFTDHDRRIIRDYFRGGYGNLPPGLAKRGGHLPPGLERHLQRNGQLPPGLQKRVEPFPHDLEARLTRLPTLTVRVVLGRTALILDERHTILDMIDDVLN
jgi:hypothetical protein